MLCPNQLITIFGFIFNRFKCISKLFQNIFSTENALQMVRLGRFFRFFIKKKFN